MNFIDTYFTHDVIDNFDCSFNEIILVHIDWLTIDKEETLTISLVVKIIINDFLPYEYQFIVFEIS